MEEHLHRATARRLEFFSWDRIAYELYRNFGIGIIKENVYYEPIRYAQNEQVFYDGTAGENEEKEQAKCSQPSYLSERSENM